MTYSLIITCDLNIHILWHQLQYSTLTIAPILNLILGCCWTYCQLSTAIGFISTGLLFIKLQDKTLQKLNAEFSTTIKLILNLFTGGSSCLASCQLYNGIRYVSIVSKLSKLLFSLEEISRNQIIFYSMANYSTTV